MADVRKLDSRRRGVFPERFKPGDLFIEERVAEDSVTFRLVKPAEVRLATVSRNNGRTMVKAPLERAKVRQAIREERDAR